MVEGIRKSLWTMDGDLRWEVLVSTKKSSYLNSVPMRSLRDFVGGTKTSLLSTAPIESIILEYMIVESNLDIKSLVALTIKCKDETVGQKETEV